MHFGTHLEVSVISVLTAVSAWGGKLLGSAVLLNGIGLGELVRLGEQVLGTIPQNHYRMLQNTLSSAGVVTLVVC